MFYATGGQSVRSLDMAFAAALAFALPLTAHAGYDEGVQAYASGDYPKAIAEFKPLAEHGDPKAQFAMGSLYHYGYGVRMDQAEAAKWFHLAADRGDAQSQYYLGMIYDKGEGIKRDPVAAYMWFSLSASNSTASYRDQLYAREEIKSLEAR
jgi:TPR repeat protein